MQIASKNHGDFVEMRIAGRLDNEWSSHLDEAIDDAVRSGSHSVVLDLTEVTYISSAGIGALVRAHKQFQAIRGFFGVGHSASPAIEVIRTTGLAKMLLCDLEQIRSTSVENPATIQPKFRVVAEWGTTFELYDIDADGTQTCEVIGDPSRLPDRPYQANDCRNIEFPANSMGFGLGAFGSDFGDCSNSFGEFLAVSGAAAQLPTSGSNTPDYQLSQDAYVPQVQMAYGVRCTGGFRHLHRFDSLGAQSRIPLSSLVEQCLKLSNTDAAAMVFVAETAGLIGASLRRSPAAITESRQPLFEHPEIRRWLSYSPDGAFAHSVALIVGIASRDGSGPLNRLLRPLGSKQTVFGHFHAAVFSYRPFKKRKLDLNSAVAALFDTEELQSVLHLLHDDRKDSGGESQFVRGACWVGPISNVTGELPK